jgi:hypothetical protein
VNKSLWKGRRDVEWWIPFVCAIALTLPLIPCAIPDRAPLDAARAVAFCLMGYAGFLIAGRSHRKKYVNRGVDGVGGGLLGVVGLAGAIAFGFPWLAVMLTYTDKERGPTPIEETMYGMYGRFIVDWPPVLSVCTAIFFFVWFVIAIYHVVRRNVVAAQQAEHEQYRAHR